MGKYTFARREPPKPRNMGVHPLMRGIGCVMMVLVPILSYGIAVLLVPVLVARGVPIPPGWLGLPAFPPLLLSGRGFASQLIIFLASQNNLIANVVFAIAIIVVLGGIMSIIYGYMYSIFGPPRYGPQDAPPPRAKAKPYKR